MITIFVLNISCKLSERSVNHCFVSKPVCTCEVEIDSWTCKFLDHWLRILRNKYFIIIIINCKTNIDSIICWENNAVYVCFYLPLLQRRCIVTVSNALFNAWVAENWEMLSLYFLLVDRSRPVKTFMQRLFFRILC